MAYLDNWATTVPRLIQGEAKLPPAVANDWPQWEIETPTRPQHSVFQVVNDGYRSDELVFACIDVRASVLAEPPFALYKVKGREKTRVDEHKVLDLLRNPNPEMGESEFIQAVSVYKDTAGFSAWEIERNNVGEPIALWPLNPAYCSFLRGPRQPIRALRYEYPGRPAVDIERSRFVLFQEFDPLYAWNRSLSRSYVAMRSIGVRTSITQFLKLFFEQGTAVHGVLSTTQSITDDDAARARREWRGTHGGYVNWGDITVLGNGLSYDSIQTNFRDMAFPEIDARTETSICQVFRVSPLIVAAKVGLNASTYSNYEQAQDALTNEVRYPGWRYLATELTKQLLVNYPDLVGHRLEMDTSDVRVLSEDEGEVWERAGKAFDRGLILEDEAREKMGFNPLTEEQLAKKREAHPIPPQLQAFTGMGAEAGEEDVVEGDFDEQKQLEAPAVDDLEERQEVMKAKLREALENVGRGVGLAFDGELAACKSRTQVRGVFEKHWPRRMEARGLEALLRELKSARRAVEVAGASRGLEVQAVQPQIIVQVEPTPISILNHVEVARPSARLVIDRNARGQVVGGAIERGE